MTSLIHFSKSLLLAWNSMDSMGAFSRASRNPLADDAISPVYCPKLLQK